jgi:hypothetical protein
VSASGEQPHSMVGASVLVVAADCFDDLRRGRKKLKCKKLSCQESKRQELKCQELKRNGSG